MSDKSKIRCPNCGRRSFTAKITISTNGCFHYGQLFLDIKPNLEFITAELTCKCGNTWTPKIYKLPIEKPKEKITRKIHPNSLANLQPREKGKIVSPRF